MITLKKNDYVKPTEIRENVVQDIIDAFLADTALCGCHLSDGKYRKKTLFVVKHKGEKAYGFSDRRLHENDETTHFHECEMERAFERLMDAGYYMFKVCKYGNWYGYYCSHSDFYDGGTMVTAFTEHWN